MVLVLVENIGSVSECSRVSFSNARPFSVFLGGSKRLECFISAFLGILELTILKYAFLHCLIGKGHCSLFIPLAIPVFTDVFHANGIVLRPFNPVSPSGFIISTRTVRQSKTHLRTSKHGNRQTDGGRQISRIGRLDGGVKPTIRQTLKPGWNLTRDGPS